MALHSTSVSAPERDLLAAARRGDEQAYRALVEPHRHELQVHCYRMLGSIHDAEDALQDALLRAWRFLPRFDGRSSLRAWLYKIATNASLDAIAKRGRRALPVDHVPAADPHDGVGEPLVESVWIEPCADRALGVQDGLAAPEARYEQRESVELAFIAAVQHLPATQRAVLILRDVLGYSAQETADSLQTTPASVNSALQRARRTVDERLPEASQQATLRSLGDQKLSDLVTSYMDAMARGDVDAVVAMLAQDAAWSMPPLASWFRGHDDVRVFLRNGPLSGAWRWRHLPTHVNGQAAVGCYTWHEEDGCFRPFALDVLTLREDGLIQEVTAFIIRTQETDNRELLARWPDEAPDADKVASVFGRLGLPDRLD